MIQNMAPKHIDYYSNSPTVQSKDSMRTKLVLIAFLTAAIDSLAWMSKWKPENFCRRISACKCEPGYYDHNIILRCNNLDENVKFYGNKSLFGINCYHADQSKVLDFKRFPPLPIQSSVTEAEIQNCVIHQNVSLALIFQHFGVKKATKFSYFRSTLDEVSLNWRFFYGFEQLVQLHLHGHITINENSFQPLTNLTKLIINVKSLSFFHNSGVFRSLKKLKQLSLDGSGLNFTDFERKSQLKNISGDLISSLMNIQRFELNAHRLSLLPTNLFVNQSTMRLLDLSSNELTELQDGLFDDLKGLVTLVLSDNNLTSISGNVFRELHSLQFIDCSYNYLKTIHSNAFVNTKHLSYIFLSNNQLSLIDDTSPFRYVDELSRLDISNNKMTTILSDWKNRTEFTLLNLRSNQISSLSYDDLQFEAKRIYINLSENAITNIDFPMIELPHTSNKIRIEYKKIRINLNDNPIMCDDCKLYYFIEYIQKQSTQAQAISIDVNQLFCGSPETMVDLRVGELNLSTFTCVSDKLNFQCPPNCQCLTRLNDSTLIYNCSNANWDHPDIPRDVLNISFIEIYIDHNNLSGFPYLINNVQVTVIQASHNSISEITVENLPPNLKFLDLSHNKIQRLAENVFNMLHSLTNLSHIFMGNNLWLCDCSQEATHFVAFVTKNTKIIKDQKQTKCLPEFITVSELSSKYIQIVCLQKYFIVTLIVLAALVTLISLMKILYDKHQKLIKIWLYTNNLCLWWVNEEELDKDKKYDAFISYSHHDEDFAIDTIVNELENGAIKYTICVHERDWLAGELIIDSIANSVAECRRTIIILSRNYLESIWGQYEFHCAHQSSITEKRVRVIVIIYGDIGNIEDLDPVLQHYLKTNTYIKWGEKWFWKNLQYAMQYKD